jgi:hypothetical protein
MSNIGPILDYVPPRALPPRLTLAESDGCVRVIFPVLPKWFYISGIVAPFGMGLVRIVMPVLVLRVLWRMLHLYGPPDPQSVAAVQLFAAGILTSLAIDLAVLWGLAAYELWMYRRWGRVPRVLTASDEGLILSRLGWLRMRERRWPASEITGVELRPLK